jgi:Zn-dependent M28 family amino/carboxypeptidase
MASDHGAIRALDQVDTINLSEHTRVLASDEFAGREPASAGESKTVTYLSRQFAALGLQPAGDHGGWTQQVPLRKVELTRSSSLRITSRAGSYTIPNGVGAVFTSLAQKSDVAIKDAPIVFVGYGVTAPERDWDDFKGVDLKGKVALFLINDPDFEAVIPGAFGGRAMTYYGRWSYKFEEAARRGAAAALIVHEDAPASYGWATVKNSWSLPQFDLARSANLNSQSLIQGWLRKDVAVRLLEQATLSFDELKQHAMRQDFAPVELSGVRLSASAHFQISRVLSHNVIAKIPGHGRPDESVLYSAHWDHLGVGKGGSASDRIYHGAMDDAIGVAGLLELARVFATAPPCERSVYFVAFTAEEKLLLGSEYYALHSAGRLERMAAAFNIDILGTNGPAYDLSIWGDVKSDLQDTLASVLQKQGRRLTSDPHLEAGYFYRSDHLPLAKRGVPALTIRSGLDLHEGGVAGGEKAYQDYMAHRYHQPADRWSSDWDLRGAASDLDALYEAGREIANSTAWPQWRADSEFKQVRDASADLRLH